MVHVFIHVRLKLRTLLRAAAALLQSSDDLHERARKEHDPEKAKGLRQEADDDSDSAREINEAMHKIDTGENEP